MPESAFEYFCHICGNKEERTIDVPSAPKLKEHSIECSSCGDTTNILITSCPSCNESVRYFVTDLDFPREVSSISNAYVEIIAGIRESLDEILEEFQVQLPESWSVEFTCECGANYSASIPLVQFDDLG